MQGGNTQAPEVKENTTVPQEAKLAQREGMIKVLVNARAQGEGPRGRWPWSLAWAAIMHWS